LRFRIIIALQSVCHCVTHITAISIGGKTKKNLHNGMSPII
jgi:hypothetical protein